MVRPFRAAQAVAAGDSWLDPAVTGRVLAAYRGGAGEMYAARDASVASSGLTPREVEVLREIGGGLTNAEIAAALVISELTVKSHIGRIFAKLGLRDRAAAVVYAFDTGLVRPAEPRQYPTSAAMDAVWAGSLLRSPNLTLEVARVRTAR